MNPPWQCTFALKFQERQMLYQIVFVPSFLEGYIEENIIYLNVF